MQGDDQDTPTKLKIDPDEHMARSNAEVCAQRNEVSPRGLARMVSSPNYEEVG